MKEDWKALGEELEKLVGTCGLTSRVDVVRKSSDVKGYWGFHQSVPTTLPGEVLLFLYATNVDMYDDVIAVGMVDENGIGAMVRTSADFDRNLEDVLNSIVDKRVYMYTAPRRTITFRAREVVELSAYWNTHVPGGLGSIPVPWQNEYIEEIEHAISLGDMGTALRFTLSDTLRLYHVYLSYKMDPQGPPVRLPRWPSPPSIPVHTVDIPVLEKD